MGFGKEQSHTLPVSSVATSGTAPLTPAPCSNPPFSAAPGPVRRRSHTSKLLLHHTRGSAVWLEGGRPAHRSAGPPGAAAQALSLPACSVLGEALTLLSSAQPGWTPGCIVAGVSTLIFHGRCWVWPGLNWSQVGGLPGEVRHRCAGCGCCWLYIKHVKASVPRVVLTPRAAASVASVFDLPQAQVSAGFCAPGTWPACPCVPWTLGAVVAPGPGVPKFRCSRVLTGDWDRGIANRPPVVHLQLLGGLDGGQ